MLVLALAPSCAQAGPDADRPRPLAPAYALDVHTVRTKPEKFTCKPIPAAPQRDVILGSVYRRDDPHGAAVDEEAQDLYADRVRDSARFETQLVRMTNLYRATGNADAASCALDWLYQWAAAKALLGCVNAQGVYARQWSLASVSSAYLQIRDYADREPDKNKTVRTWLRLLASTVRTEYDKTGRRLNNHYYWAAWAVTNTGVALNRRDFYAWGVDAAKYALTEQARDDGTLPLEMQRGKKALHYHVFALAPLVMIAETAARNGEDLYEIRDGILHRLVQTVFAAVQDPGIFTRAAGIPQEPVAPIAAGHYAWLEVYNARFPDADILLWLAPLRPVFSRRTGGDMTALYGDAGQ